MLVFIATCSLAVASPHVTHSAASSDYVLEVCGMQWKSVFFSVFFWTESNFRYQWLLTMKFGEPVIIIIISSSSIMLDKSTLDYA